MKITKKAFADILGKRFLDRIIFAHLESGFCGIKLVRRQSRHTNFFLFIFFFFFSLHFAKIQNAKLTLESQENFGTRIAVEF